MGSQNNQFMVDGDILIYAFRYTLGRRTYATGVMQDLLEENWDKLKPSTKILIKREIQEAQRSNRLGDSMDSVGWVAILSWD